MKILIWLQEYDQKLIKFERYSRKSSHKLYINKFKDVNKYKRSQKQRDKEGISRRK